MAQLPLQIVAIAAKTDEVWYKRLALQLTILRRMGKISLWHSSQILPAHDIIQERNSHLDAASLLLLFLSPDFFASTDCQEQLQRALPRHAAHAVLMLPIIVRPIDLSHSPLATIKALPSNGRAIVEWHDTNVAVQDIAEGIHTLIYPLTSNTQRTYENT